MYTYKNVKYYFNIPLFKELMHERKLNASQVADKIEISRESLKDLERGKKKNPSADLLARLADFFIVRMEELLIKESENKKPPVREENWKRVNSL